MKITDQKLGQFSEMARNFARRYDLGVTLTTNTLKTETAVKFNDLRRSKTYGIIWDETPSLSDAASHIFADVLNIFNLIEIPGSIFEIKDVIFNNPATVVLWKDGTKTVVKCQTGDIYEKEVGLALCIAKKALGNKGNFNNVFKKWIHEEEPVTVGDVFEHLDDPNTISSTLNDLCDRMKNFFGGKGCD